MAKEKGSIEELQAEYDSLAAQKVEVTEKQRALKVKLDNLINLERLKASSGLSDEQINALASVNILRVESSVPQAGGK